MAIIGIIAVMSLPVYNQYVEKTKVSKEIPVIGTYKNDIAACFMKNDSLEDCNDGESGIHPGLNNNGKIMSLDVFKGNIVMIIDAQNHMENVEPVELMYVINPNLDATFPTLDWTLYCNDYSTDNNALVKECKGLITDKDGDGYDDSVEEEWGSDPLDPDSVPVNWEPIAPTYTAWSNNGGRVYTTGWTPEASNQTSDFTQTRSYTQEQERTVSQREENSSTGDVRVVSTSTETRTINDSASRTVTVSEGAWVNDGGVYGCGSWSPALSNQTSDFTQTRSCSQDQTKTYTYSIGGSFTAERTTTVSQSQVVEVTSTAGGSGDGWSNWSTYNTSCGGWGPSASNYPQGQSFTQTRSCTDYQERLKYFVVNGQVVDSDRETRTRARTESRTATGTKEVLTCYYERNTLAGEQMISGWKENAFSGSLSYIKINNVVIKNLVTNGSLGTYSNGQPMYTVNGKSYVRGSLGFNTGTDKFYEVCRIN